jgi:Spy/CpxP family protein refolding chaperone
MFSKTKIALAAALVLGAASAALAANEHDDSVSEAQAMREHGNPLPWWWNVPAQGRASAFAQGGDAFGYSASQTENLTHKKSHNR